MKIQTMAELREEIPSDWRPDPVALLGRLESLIASGLHIGYIERRSGISEGMLNALLDEKKRTSLGMIDVPNAHLSAFNGGRDPFGERKVLFQLNAWLNAHDEERRQMAREYTEIDTGLYMTGIALEALEKKRLFHLIGGYGISKTKTMERFAANHPMTHEAPGAVYLSLTAEDRTTAQVYQRLNDALRIGEKFKTSGRSIGQRVRNAFRPGDLVIVDEANYAFTYGTWPTFRDIYDVSPVSLLMVSNITSNGFVKAHQEELGAFLSRARTRTIEGNVKADGEKYATALGFSCPRLIQEAGRIVTSKGQAGGMRFLSKAFEDAEQMAAKRGSAVNVAILREAAKINSVFFK